MKCFLLRHDAILVDSEALISDIPRRAAGFRALNSAGDLPAQDRLVGFAKRRTESYMPDLIDHLGAWEGTWLTFLLPDELHDESPLRATIDRDGSGFVINYHGSIQGDEVTGRLRWSETGGTATVDWVDSWHTGGKQARLEGFDDAPPSYQYGGDDPWTWDITIDATDSGVTVTHHNAGPAVPRYVGVLMRLENRSS